MKYTTHPREIGFWRNCKNFVTILQRERTFLCEAGEAGEALRLREPAHRLQTGKENPHYKVIIRSCQNVPADTKAGSEKIFENERKRAKMEQTA